MHVVATAGHVDHGKSTLVRALTGTDPDRLAEERRRGLTIELGFASTVVDGEEVAFVDVPGHERFVPTMLAGVGPVPAVLFVVAADGGWMPQSAEHLDALHALGVRHGLLVVTRADLADPAPATAQAREHLARTTLAGAEAVAVSARTGAGMAELREALARAVRSLPPPDVAAPVRLWVDRVFSVRGAGTVVTGTLPAGTVRVGERLALPGGRSVVVRGLQALGRNASEVSAVARVAVNLRGVSTDEVRRGDALTTPGTHLDTSLVDVRVSRDGAVPAACLLHVGAAHVGVRARPLDDAHVRLLLRSPLPLRIGDVGLLRDPGRHEVVGGVTVLDVDPPALRRRGAARERAAALAGFGATPDLDGELRRRRVVRAEHLRAMGVPVDGNGWLVDPGHAAVLRERLVGAVADHAERHPLEPGLPVEAARHLLDLPDAGLVAGLAEPPLALHEGRVVDTRRGGGLPGPLATSLAKLTRDLADRPWSAPEAHRLRELGLGPRELATAVRAGALARVGDGVYLTAEAVARAHEPLRALPQPFSLSEARQAWGSTRRVAVPLLELLDRDGRTRRLPDDRRVVVDGTRPA
ncbi:MAG: selenocysteine-specific translation elongation factor [Actinomycetes bacterium]